MYTYIVIQMCVLRVWGFWLYRVCTEVREHVPCSGLLLLLIVVIFVGGRGVLQLRGGGRVRACKVDRVSTDRKCLRPQGWG